MFLTALRLDTNFPESSSKLSNKQSIINDEMFWKSFIFWKLLFTDLWHILYYLYLLSLLYRLFHFSFSWVWIVSDPHETQGKKIENQTYATLQKSLKLNLNANRCSLSSSITLQIKKDLVSLYIKNQYT